MIDEIKDQPLLPKNPAGAAVAGGTLTGVLAAIGWVASEMISLEKLVTHVGDQIVSTQKLHDGQILEFDKDVIDLQKDIDDFRERLAILEKEVFDLEK